MAAVLPVVLLILSVSSGGFSQCYTTTECTGRIAPGSNPEECCVGTGNGVAFLDAGVCIPCHNEMRSLQKRGIYEVAK